VNRKEAKKEKDLKARPIVNQNASNHLISVICLKCGSSENLGLDQVEKSIFDSFPLQTTRVHVEPSLPCVQKPFAPSLAPAKREGTGRKAVA